MTQRFSLFLVGLLVLCSGLAVAQQDDTTTPPSSEEQPIAVAPTVQALFTSVRDTIAFQAYAGAMKGAEQTEAEGSGNSLDRALLLHKKLSEAGYKPSIVQGRLFGNALERVLARSQGLVPAEEGRIPQLNPVADRLLGRVLSDHFWVQVPVGEDRWLDLDSTMPDAVPGQTIAGFRKRIKQLPSHLFQLLEIDVWAEFRNNGRSARARMLRFVKPTMDLLGKPISLQFVRKTSDGRFVFAKTGRTYPVLWFNGTSHPAINLEAEAARAAVRNGGLVEPVDVRRIWLEYDIRSPADTVHRQRRTLFDARHPDASRLDELLVFQLNTSETTAGPAFIEQLRTQAAYVTALQPTQQTQVLTESERQTVARIAELDVSLAGSTAYLFTRSLQQIQSCVRQAFISLPGYVSPHLVIVGIAPERGLSFDIATLDTAPAVNSPRDSQAVAAAFAATAAAMILEDRIVSALLLQADSNSAYAASMDYAAAGGAWLAVDVARFGALLSSDIDENILRQMQHSVDNGYILVVPQVAASDSFFWWEVDRITGSVRAMLAPGIGGARLAWQDGLENEWNYIAGSFPPLFDPAWPQRLALMARNAAASLENGESIDAERLSGQIVSVYDLLYRALAADPALALSQPVREFFTPSGRILLSGALGSMCVDQDIEQE